MCKTRRLYLDMSVGLDADASSLGGEIICRTASTLLSNICGYQPSKFQRSRKYKGTGYFSVASKPYKPFGEILDLDSLGIASQLPNTDNEFHPLFSLATHVRIFMQYHSLCMQPFPPHRVN